MGSAGVKIIGVSGGSCSGKTTLARRIVQALGADRCALVFQDSYYIDQSGRFREDGGEVNFDHPDSIEFSLLARQLDDLRSGRAIEVPVYDFVTHKRLERTERLEPRAFVLVDGTLILSQDVTYSRFDRSVFIEASEELRFSRRIKRDTQERGRSHDGVVKQFMNHVKPMHDLFVESSRSKATCLFSGESCVDSEISTLLVSLGLRPEAI